MRIIRIIFTLSLIVIFSTASKVEKLENTITAKELMNKMTHAIDGIKTMRFTLKYNERFKGNMKFTSSKTKLQVKPRKVYVNNGEAEVLWVEGKNNGNAWVKPNTFPYVTISLDPMGNIMRKSSHHTIHDSGFNHLKEVIQGSAKKAGEKFDEYFVVLGDEVFNGKPCYKLYIKYPEFKWIPYTVKKGETMVSIARRNYLSEHMLLEKNTKYGWYDDVKEGDVIQIPTGYSKLTVMLIDKELFLPISNKIYDDLGLYETFDYHDLHVNAPIPDEEFTKSYKEYRF